MSKLFFWGCPENSSRNNERIKNEIEDEKEEELDLDNELNRSGGEDGVVNNEGNIDMLGKNIELQEVPVGNIPKEKFQKPSIFLFFLKILQLYFPNINH